jgi:hypothetical protein
MSAVKSNEKSGTDDQEPKSEAIAIGLSTSMALPQKLLEANLATGAELIGFASRRMQAQADFWNEMSHCHDLGDATVLQYGFADKASKDYADEMQRLLDLVGRNGATVAAGLARTTTAAEGKTA